MTIEVLNIAYPYDLANKTFPWTPEIVQTHNCTSISYIDKENICFAMQVKNLYQKSLRKYYGAPGNDDCFGKVNWAS